MKDESDRETEDNPQDRHRSATRAPRANALRRRVTLRAEFIEFTCSFSLPPRVTSPNIQHRLPRSAFEWANLPSWSPDPGTPAVILFESAP